MHKKVVHVHCSINVYSFVHALELRGGWQDGKGSELGSDGKHKMPLNNFRCFHGFDFLIVKAFPRGVCTVGGGTGRVRAIGRGIPANPAA